jgi:hexosaminidase
VLGLEGPLFTETVRDQALMDYLLMPRMLALAERAWSADPPWARATDASRARALHDADWSAFVNQLGQRVLPKLDVEYPGVLYRIAAPGLRLVQGQVLANHQLPGFTLRYSTDGSEPTALSPLVQGPIAVKGKIRVAAFAANGRRGQSSVLENR